MPRKIIALVGFAGVGKTTVTKEVLSAHDLQDVTFAEPLKDSIRAMSGRRAWDMEPQYAKEALFHPGKLASLRDALEAVGNAVRGIEPKYWIYRHAERLDELDALGRGRFVVSDCRFPNEARYLRDAGAMVIYLHRSEVEAKAPWLTRESDRMVRLIADDQLYDHWVSTDDKAHGHRVINQLVREYLER